ncbi:MAG: CAP domain-containing protein [Elainellaceae cyanobacterium]
MARDRAGNSVRQARNITLKAGRNTFRDAVGQSDQNDFYRFRLNRSSRLSVSLSNLTANADVAILNQAKTVTQRSSLGGRRAEKLTANLEPGIYFVRVYQRQGNTRYRLGLSSRPNSVGGAEGSTLTPAVAPAPSSSNSSPLNPLLRQVLNLTNAARQQLNLPPLRINTTLNEVARQHSAAMATGDFFSHEDPSGRRPHERIAAADYGFRATAENIAAGYATADRVFQAWMNSPSHRVNILDPRLEEIGLGYVYLAADTGNVNHNHYWTQVFTQPLS